MIERRPVLTITVLLTGGSALALQVAWQRVLALHSGVDLSSTTTVVAASLAGLGFGSILGGRLADRFGAAGSLRIFALSNAGIAAFAVASVPLLDAVSSRATAGDGGVARLFLVHFGLLLIPTTLQGLSLPLLITAWTRRIADVASTAGRLYGLNTLGAAAGAAVTGWVLLGTYGIATTTRIAAGANLLAVALTTVEDRRPTTDPVGAVADPTPQRRSPASSGAVATRLLDRPGVWCAVYGFVGAVALAFEIVMFRVVDSVMRSNSYSFGHVLMIYLGLFGAGALIGGRLVRRAGNPRTWFAWLQCGVGISASAALILVFRVLPSGPFGGWFDRWFASEGYNTGFGGLSEQGIDWWSLAVVFVVLPLVLMSPVLLMGMSYPFVQQVVATHAGRIGIRTGALLGANLAGNVGGAVLAGFVLVDRLGTSGTYMVLTLACGAMGLLALSSSEGRRRLAGCGALVSVVIGAVWLTPSNDQLWRTVNGGTHTTVVAEDRSCVSALTVADDGHATLLLNGSLQNGHPYDDFHVLIGLLPSLAHPSPEQGLVVGLGVGSTTFGMLADPRWEAVTTLELCGGNVELLRWLARHGRNDVESMLDDPRSHLLDGDGRRHLQRSADGRYDVITSDTLRPQSAFSGSHYSTEFYRLAADRLSADGVFAQWVPTGRSLNGVAQVFPHVVTVDAGSTFVLASHSPIDLDPERLLARFSAVPNSTLSVSQRRSIERFLRDLRPRCVVDGTPWTPAPDDQLNRDLRPRDEYFLNNDGVAEPWRDGCDEP